MKITELSLLALSMAKEKVNIDSRIVEVSEKLRELRRAKGFSSYKAFAQQHDIDSVQYQRVETGSNLTLKTLLRVLDIHGLTLKDFFNSLD